MRQLLPLPDQRAHGARWTAFGLLLLLLLVGGQGHAYGVVDTPSFAEPPPAAADDTQIAEEGTQGQLVRVEVSGLPEGETLSLVVHVLRPPHEIVASVEAQTNAQGFAEARVPVVEGAQVFAQAERGRAFFSEAPVALVAQEEPLRVEIALPEPTRDRSRVAVATLIVIVEPSEDHLMVTQLMTMGVEGDAHYTPEEGAPALELPLLHGATSLMLIEGEGRAEVRQNRLVHTASVAPLSDPGIELDRIVVRYAIRTLNARDVELRATFDHPVLDGLLLTPLATPFSRFPELDVTLDASLCEADAAGPCFRERVNRDPTGMIRQHIGVRGFQGLRAPAGSELIVQSSGWPSRFPWERWAATLLGWIAALVGGAIFLREWKRRRDERSGLQRRRTALEAQRLDLLHQQLGLEEALAEGELLEAEYAHARAEVTEELALIHRRLRELEEATEAEA